MRVCFTGSSGSGKTTLVHYVQQEFELPWLNGSSGGLKDDVTIDRIESLGLKQGQGHREIIQSGHAHPTAAWENQKAILLGRNNLMNAHDRFVTDRSPIDNMVYATLQCGPYQHETDMNEFMDNALSAMARPTHLIYIPSMLPSIEDNGSRITNPMYQRAVDFVFKGMIEEIYDCGTPWLPKLLTLNVVDLEERKRIIVEFLKGTE